MHFVYTGTLPMPCVLNPDHITAVLMAGQKLGLDVAKLALILSAFVALSEPRYRVLCLVLRCWQNIKKFNL